MARLLYRLGSTAYRRWPFFIAAWLTLAIFIGGVASVISKPMLNKFTIPGIPSEKAGDLQTKLFPDAKDPMEDTSVTVVVAAEPGGRLEEPKNQEAIAALIKKIRGLPQFSSNPRDNPGLMDPVAAAAAQEQGVRANTRQLGGDDAQAAENVAAISPLSKDGRVGTMTFEWDAALMDVKPASKDAVKDVVKEASRGGLTVEANGPGMASNEAPGGTAELIGLAIALMILLLTFGSLVAGGMPIVNAIFGVALGIIGVTAMTAFFSIGTMTPMLATMLGLAVGIDYTLFILARYRTELRHTTDRAHAAGIAVGTAGSAVVFAGLTVIIALSALSVVGIPFLTAMGLAAAMTVLLAVLVALSLLPALLGMLKSWTFRIQVRKYKPKFDEQGLLYNGGVRWARLVGRAPAAFALVVIIALSALALPVSQMQLGFPTDSTAPSDTTQRKAANLMSDAFGPGRSGPLVLVVDGRKIKNDDQRTAAFGDVVTWANSREGVSNAQLVATNAPTDAKGQPRGPSTGGLVQILPEKGPEDPATLDLLNDLRDGEARIATDTGTNLAVGGLTAINTDVADRLTSALVPYLAIVIGLAFILLLLVFRSILVPLTATVGFLFSVLATLGATVAIFQEGAFGIFEGQPLVSFMPIFLIGVVFGLAMDYQVFLVTRIREAHVHGASAREAVVDGFRNSARVVTAAALIMTAVFAGFIMEPEPFIKAMGFALAISIILDAFAVRMVLIPATLYLMGEKAWWLPKWLDRILPVVDVEGQALERDSIATRARSADGENAPEPDREPVKR